MDSVTIVANKDAHTTYQLANYWTNDRYTVRGTKKRAQRYFMIFTGVADFQFLSDYGIIICNFLDFFYGPILHYNVDQEINPTFNLYFDVKK